MSTPSRSFLPASIGPALTLFTAWSVYAHGPLALPSTLGFILTLVWGMVEITLFSYTPIASIELDDRSLLDTPPAPADEAAVVDFPVRELRGEEAA